jgi:hypothetical protein
LGSRLQLHKQITGLPRDTAEISDAKNENNQSRNMR